MVERSIVGAPTTQVTRYMNYYARSAHLTFYLNSSAPNSEKSAIVENSFNNPRAARSCFSARSHLQPSLELCRKRNPPPGRSSEIFSSAARYFFSFFDADASLSDFLRDHVKLQFRRLRAAVPEFTAFCCPVALLRRFLEMFRMRLNDAASGEKFFVLRIACSAPTRSTASTRSSEPAANAALISS